MSRLRAPDARARRYRLQLALGVVLAVGGALWWVGTPTPAGDPSSGTSVARPIAADPPATARPAPWRPGAPRRLLIPALGVAAPVIPVATSAGTLVPPGDPRTLGWWAAGAVPGASRGTALLTGHTVHTGGGALDHLAQLRPGDRVVVRTAHERLRYVVRSVRVLSKGSLSTHADRLFDQRVRGRLVVVTCADWDGTRYLANVVVTADPAPRPQAARARSASR
jgi:LPXTG-site transpeptidase (sortase) family protein